jgi:hypothetical protein
MDGLVDRRLIQAAFAGDLACVLSLALPLGLGQFGRPFFQDQSVLSRELFDPVEDLAHGLTYIETS